MLVKELIEILQKCKPNAEVHFAYHESCTSPVEWVRTSVYFEEIRLSCTRPSWQVVRLSLIENGFGEVNGFRDDVIEE